MTLQHWAAVVICLGWLPPLAAWTFCRQPGVGFWRWRPAPIWRASEFVTPLGVALWRAGFAMIALGALLFAFGRWP